MKKKIGTLVMHSILFCKMIGCLNKIMQMIIRIFNIRFIPYIFVFHCVLYQFVMNPNLMTII